MEISAFVFVVLPLVSLQSHASTVSEIAFDDGQERTCNIVSETRPLRYMKTYQFYLDWVNSEDRDVYLNSYEVKYKNASFLTVGKPFQDGSEFYWTQILVDSKYKVPERKTMRVLSNVAEDWGVVRHPEIRSRDGAWDFLIGYKVDYDYSNNNPDTSDDKSILNCQPYYVTWCGDGIKDDKYEECDGMDGVGARKTCSSTCTLLPSGRKEQP